MRFDEEICKAAEPLRPYGHKWLDEMGRAFMALKEDRKYLPQIVSRLVEDAHAELDEIWRNQFCITASGEMTSEASFVLLRKAQSKGYTLTVEENRTIVVSRGSSNLFLRSNYDIERFLRF